MRDLWERERNQKMRVLRRSWEEEETKERKNDEARSGNGHEPNVGGGGGMRRRRQRPEEERRKLCGEQRVSGCNVFKLELALSVPSMASAWFMSAPRLYGPLPLFVTSCCEPTRPAARQENTRRLNAHSGDGSWAKAASKTRLNTVSLQHLEWPVLSLNTVKSR